MDTLILLFHTCREILYRKYYLLPIDGGEVFTRAVGADNSADIKGTAFGKADKQISCFLRHRDIKKPGKFVQLMDKLEKWFAEQFIQKKIEPNSNLGEVIKYVQNHWQAMTGFFPVFNTISTRVY
jgi:hypothetical protein